MSPKEATCLGAAGQGLQPATQLGPNLRPKGSGPGLGPRRKRQDIRRSWPMPVDPMARMFQDQTWALDRACRFCSDPMARRVQDTTFQGTPLPVSQARESSSDRAARRLPFGVQHLHLAERGWFDFFGPGPAMPKPRKTQECPGKPSKTRESQGMDVILLLSERTK